MKLIDSRNLVKKKKQTSCLQKDFLIDYVGKTCQQVVEKVGKDKFGLLPNLCSHFQTHCEL